MVAWWLKMWHCHWYSAGLIPGLRTSAWPRRGKTNKQTNNETLLFAPCYFLLPEMLCQSEKFDKISIFKQNSDVFSSFPLKSSLLLLFKPPVQYSLHFIQLNHMFICLPCRTCSPPKHHVLASCSQRLLHLLLNKWMRAKISRELLRK